MVVGIPQAILNPRQTKKQSRRYKRIEVGDRFNRLVIVELLSGSHTVQANARVRCDCGTETIVQRVRLKSGTTRSCGCLRQEIGREWGKRRLRHGGRSGGTASRTFRSWISMKTRCLNPKATGFHNWGGRGITVCDRWLNSFENFLADMGERPEGKSLDRWPDPNGNYEPGNCRWATAEEQRGNQRPQTPRA